MSSNGKIAKQTIVIAGAGIVGLSTAYYLFDKYEDHVEKIVLIDPSGTIAPGASGKAAGFLAKGWNDGTPTEALTHRSFGLHEELANKFHADEIGYRIVDCVYMHLTKPTATALKLETRKNAKTQRSSRTAHTMHKEPVEWAKPSPDLKIEDVSRMGAKGTTAQVLPKKLCDKLWQAVEQKGCVLKKGKVVGALHNSQGDLEGALLDDGTAVPTDVLVYACGPWVANIMLGVKVHAVVLPTEQKWKQCVFFYSDETGDSEVFVRPDSTAFCSGDHDDPVTVNEEAGKEEIDEAKIKEILDRLERSSGLKVTKGDNDKLKKQACYQPATKDFLPVIGELSRDTAGGGGCYIAGGLNCWGILLGPATGECIADLICAGTTKVGLKDLQPSRFRNLKLVPSPRG